MQQCLSCLCARLPNGQFSETCVNQDCFKFCIPTSNTGLGGYDIRTIDCKDCATVFANYPEAINRCMASCKAPASAADFASGLDMESPEELQAKNRKIIGIALFVLVAILAIAAIYYFL